MKSKNVWHLWMLYKSKLDCQSTFIINEYLKLSAIAGMNNIKKLWKIKK